MPWVPISPVPETWAALPLVAITTEDGIELTTEDGQVLITEQSVLPDEWTAIPITETT